MNAINKQQKYSLSLYFFCLALIFIYLNFLRATFDEKGEDFGPLIRIMSVSEYTTVKRHAMSFNGTSIQREFVDVISQV